MPPMGWMSQAVAELLSKGSDGMEGRRRAEKWIMQRFTEPG